MLQQKFRGVGKFPFRRRERGWSNISDTFIFFVWEGSWSVQWEQGTAGNRVGGRGPKEEHPPLKFVVKGRIKS